MYTQRQCTGCISPRASMMKKYMLIMCCFGMRSLRAQLGPRHTSWSTRVSSKLTVLQFRKLRYKMLVGPINFYL